MAVYTQITKNEAEKIFKQYNIGQLVNIEAISSGIQNTNYLATTETNKYVLTIFEQQNYVKHLDFYIQYMLKLNENDISCPKPVLQNNGKHHFIFGKKKGVVVPFLAGRTITNIKPIHVKQVGCNLAKMHLVSKNNSFNNTPKINRLSQIDEYYSSIKNSDFTAAYKDLIELEIAFQKEHYPRNIEEGIIHSDLFTDNVFFVENKLSAIIDIYDSHIEYFAYDLAVTINDWCFEKTNNHYALKLSLYESMLAGYEDIRPLSVQEKAAFKTILRAASLKNMLMRIRFNHFNKAAIKLNPKDINEYASKLTYWHKS